MTCCRRCPVLVAMLLALPAAAQVAPAPNLAAKHALEVRWRFEHLPGRIEAVSARADYQIENIDCVPPDQTRAPGGVRLRPRHSLPLAAPGQDDGTLRARVQVDAFAPQDHFGLGACRWQLQGITLTFHAPHHAVPFVAAFSMVPVPEGALAPLHFPVSDFEQRPPAAIEAVFGEPPGHWAANRAQFVLRAHVSRVK